MRIVICGTSNLFGYMQTTVRAIRLNNPNADISVITNEGGLEIGEAETINLGRKLFTTANSPNKNTSWTQMTYARLFLPQMFNDDKILYLDVDCIVDKPLDALFDIDMGNNIVAGVKEPDKSRNRTYLNAGVLLFNTKLWNEGNYTEKVMDLINTRQLTYPDQDALNEVCQGRILELGCEYNSNPFCGFSDDPYIVHFAWQKPWGQRVAHDEYWFKYEKH